jgi:hypothetical protein
MALRSLSFDSAWGGHEIRSWLPEIRDFDNVYCLPFRFNDSWGVFDAENNIVLPSVDYEGTQNNVVFGQVLKSNTRFDDIVESLPDDEYIYGGRLGWHFGHFIVETLPRLWPLLDGKPPGLKVVFHGEFTPDHYFESHPFTRQMFAALNIGLEDIIYCDRPFRIKRLTIPSPSFQQQSFGHTVFVRLCHAIGAKLMAGDTSGAKARPVYISKSQLTRGVTRVVNEIEFEHVLAKNGIEIIYPERLTLEDQIRLFANRRVISGTAGSFFHGSIFTPLAGRLAIISPSIAINSNYFLIDKLNNNNSSYYLADAIQHMQDEPRTFQSETRFLNPVELGKEFSDMLWCKKTGGVTSLRKSLLAAISFR